MSALRQTVAPGAMSPLFVRIPSEQARRLDRASFERGRSKQALVSELVERYLDAPQASSHASRRRRFTVEALEPEAPLVGHHSFRPYERDPAEEVLSSEEAAQLLRVDRGLVEQLAEDGELPGRSLAGEWRFARAALIAWLSAPGQQRPDEPARERPRGGEAARR